MRRDDLCDFCQGRSRHFYLKHDRPAFWFCKPCDGTGVTRRIAPPLLPIGAAQGRFLKPYPETES